MNVLVLSINYVPEPTGFGPHVAMSCEYLVKQGHSVTVITGFPFAPYWARWPDYRGKLFSRENIHGVHVVRVTHFIPSHPGRMLQRLWMEGSFCLSAGIQLLVGIRSRWNIVLYVGAQPSIAMLARWISKLHRIPYVVNVNDLASEAAQNVGIVKSTWLAKLLDSFEFSAYRRASGAMVLCESFKKILVSHGFPQEHIRVIHSPVDLDLIRPLPNDLTFREELSLSKDDFVILYSGSMGLKQGLHNVIEAAKLLKDAQPSIKWVLVGDGEVKSALQNLIGEYTLSEQILLIALQPKDRMPMMFSSADVLLLNQVAAVKDSVIPSKLLTYMGAGKPVLAAVNRSSQAANILKESQGGVIVPPEDPEALVEAVNSLKDQRSSLIGMGKHNRKFAETHFDQKHIFAAQESFLKEIVEEVDIGVVAS